MMPEPFFSVVIPTYNRASFINAAVRTVLNQTYQDFEVIVVDDGSTDNTASEVRMIQDPRLRYFSKPNAERGAARNFGVRQARGKYISFLDSDDTIYPHHLQTAYEFLSRHPVEICHLGFDVKDVKGKVLQKVDHLMEINRAILFGNVLSCNGVIARRDVLMEHPFSEDRALSSLEDWELWVRLSARYTIHSVHKVTSTVIHHEDRSVLSGKRTAIEAKVNCFISSILSDPVNQEHFGSRLSSAVASAHTYAALHLHMAGATRGEVWRHFSEAARRHPGILLTRRSAVIILMLLGIK